ncbi:hypothetical protein AVEN_234416-1 [Araneus ventricosus]|uniref:Uncharacterized protein n=1 Tax=Araneus ventricosus TaxID=182803 RepID=A0A4Y2A8L0_ARAVE|nr:hypothetical protein AVEN_234416-1 [Araneus ventricosus]
MEVCEVHEWVAENDSEEITDQEIVETVLQTNADLIEEPEVNDRVTTDDGFRALEIALRFVQYCSESTPTDILLMRRWRDLAA